MPANHAKDELGLRITEIKMGKKILQEQINYIDNYIDKTTSSIKKITDYIQKIEGRFNSSSWFCGSKNRESVSGNFYKILFSIQSYVAALDDDLSKSILTKISNTVTSKNLQNKILKSLSLHNKNDLSELCDLLLQYSHSLSDKSQKPRFSDRVANAFGVNTAFFKNNSTYFAVKNIQALIAELSKTTEFMLFVKYYETRIL